MNKSLPQKVTDSTRNNYLAILNTYTAIHLFCKFEAALLDKPLCLTVDSLKHKLRLILDREFSDLVLSDWFARVFPSELKQYIDKEKIIDQFYQFCEQVGEEIENQNSSKGIFSKWNAQVEMYNLKKSWELRLLESFEGKQNHLIDSDKVNLSENIGIRTKEARIILMLLGRMEDKNKLSLLEDQLKQNQELLSDSELGLGLKGEAKKIWNTAQLSLVLAATKESLLSNKINIVHSRGQSAQQPIKIDGNEVSEPVERADSISSIIESDPAIKESLLSNKINIVHSSFRRVYEWIFEQITAQKVTDSTRNNYLAILNTYTAIHLFRKFEAALLDKQLCPTVDLLKHKFKSILHKKFSNQGLLNWLARVFPPELKQYIDKKKIIHRFYQFCKQAKEEIENQDSSKGIFSKWNAQVEMYNLKKSRELRLESFEDKQNHLIDLDKVNLSENIDIYTKEAGIIRMLLSRMKDENKLLLLAEQLEENQELLSDSDLGLELKGEAKKIWNTAKILFVPEHVEREDSISPIIESDPAIKKSILSNNINIVHSSFEEVHNWIFEQIAAQKITDSTRDNYLAILNTCTAIHLFRKLEATLLDKQPCLTVDSLKRNLRLILDKEFSNQRLLDWFAQDFPPELKKCIDKEEIIARFYQFCKQAEEEIENQDSSRRIFLKWNAQVEMYNLKKSWKLCLSESFEGEQNHLIDSGKVNLSKNIGIRTKEIHIMIMLLSIKEDKNKLSLLENQLKQNQELLSDSDLGLGLKGEAKKIWNTAQILYVPDVFVID